jgi:hypothetical protein
VGKRRPDPRREGAAELFQGITLVGLRTVGVSKCDADPAAIGTLALDGRRQVHELLGQKEEGVAEQIDPPARGCHQVRPLRVWDVRAVSIGGDDL